jgi:hypothetical protein
MHSILRNVTGIISGPPIEQMNDLVHHIELTTDIVFDENPINEYIDTNYDINSITNDYHYNHLSINAAVSIINKVYGNSLTKSSPRVKGRIGKDLYAHQEAMLAAMIFKERELLSGPYYNRVGVLGSSAGSGKTLTVLAHITHNKSLGPLDEIPGKSVSIYNNMYSSSIYDITYKSNAPILVVVSEYAFNEWKDEIRINTYLDALYIDKPADIRKLGAADSIKDIFKEHDFILLNANYFNKFIDEIEDEMVVFKRVYVDSPESIHFKRTAPLLNAGFIWYITNAWQMFLPNIRFYPLAYIRSNLTLDSEWEDELKESALATTNIEYPTNYNYYDKYTSFSSNNYKQIIRCREDFIKHSMGGGSATHSIIACKISRELKASINLLTNKVQTLIEDKNIDGVYEELGVECCTKNGLTHIINDNIDKEFNYLSNNNSASEIAINIACSNKKTLIIDRIAKSHECPVCFEDISESVYLPCCHNLICNKCGINIITKSCKMKCIYCRHNNTMNDIKYVNDKDIVYPNVPTKSEMIFNYVRDLSGKAIIYANNEREFSELFNEFNKHKMQYIYISDDLTRVGLKRLLKNIENAKVILISINSLFKSIKFHNITHILTMYRLKKDHKDLIISKINNHNIEYVSFLYQEGIHDNIAPVLEYETLPISYF